MEQLGSLLLRLALAGCGFLFMLYMRKHRRSEWEAHERLEVALLVITVAAIVVITVLDS